MTIGSPPMGPGMPGALVRWLTEVASEVNAIRDKVDRPAKEPWDVSSISEVRTFDASSATAGDVRSALATLVRDLINKGVLTGNRV